MRLFAVPIVMGDPENRSFAFVREPGGEIYFGSRARVDSAALRSTLEQRQGVTGISGEPGFDCKRIWEY
jgi:hypothetical protein